MKFKRLLSMICAISIIMSVSVVSGAMTDDTTAVGFNDEEAVVILGEDAGTGEENSAVDASVFDDLSADALDLVYSRLNNLLSDFWDSETMTLGDIIEGYVAIVDEETGIKLDVDYFTQRFEQNYDLEGREISTSFLDELLGATIDNVTTTYGQDAVETLYNVIKNTNIVNLFAVIYIKPELAATGQCGDNVYWTFDKETGALTISGTGDMYDYWERPFCGDSSIKSVTIGSGVTSIGYKAFYECTGLTSVKIPDSVTYIEGGAFRGCSSLASVEIPDSVTRVGESAFEDCSSLTSVRLSDNITEIYSATFCSCSSLESITIPDNVTEIDYCAFSACSSLKNVTIPENVTYIGEYAFYDCDITGDFVIPSRVIAVGYQAFEKNRNLETLTISEGVRTIGENAFALCESLKSVTIPWSVKNLHYGAFYGCDNITDISYNGTEDRWNNLGGTEYFGLDMSKANIHFCNGNPNGKCGDNVYWTFDTETGTLTISGTGEMWACETYSPYEYESWYNYISCFEGLPIEKVIIKPGVTSIGDGEFYDCYTLTSVEIPDSVTSIGEDAFYDCSNLTAVYISDIDVWAQIDFVNYASNPLYYAENLYLNNELVTDVVLSDTVTKISDKAFFGFESLKSITIPNSVTSIGYSALYGCTGLTSVEIPNSVTSIGDYAFSDCTGLTSVTIGNSVTTIGVGAFYECTNLTNIVIPDSVTSIGECAFSCCTSLKSVTIGNGVTSIGYEAFYCCKSLTSIEIPDTVTNIGESAFACCTSLTSITVDENNVDYSSDSYGVLYNKDKTELIQYPIGNERSSFEIPSTVESIGDVAFAFCDKLTNVKIGNNVTSIGNWAFEECTSLTSIEIPDSVTTTDYGAFSGCTGLTNVTFGNGLKYIEWYAFSGCTSLENIVIPDSVMSVYDDAFACCTSLTSVTIGNSVTSIGWYTFYGCTSLTSIVIPDSVTSIGDEAFEGCNNMCILCNKGSYAHQYAIENGIPFEFIKTVRSVSIPDMTIRYRSSAYISPLFDADDGAEYTISYSSSNPSVISVDNSGKVTSNRVFGFNPGSATITCTVTDSYGKIFTCTSTVNARFTPIQWFIKIVLFGWVWY